MTGKENRSKQMTEKNNGLSSAQEVLYQEEFKKAVSATKDENQKQQHIPKN